MPLNPKYFKHPGLYAYRREFLLKYPTLSPTPLEQAEKLEQLRVIEHGYRIALIRADAPHPGIDTPQQYAAFVRRMKEAAARKG
jgi:3-deoxy-manno-octulosonate cytidylyltransferase (CMP-KDO synthetase)